MTARQMVALGGLLGALGVAFGAFGAHALKTKLSPEDLQIIETAVRYQTYHGLALIGLGGWADRHPAARWALVARLFGVGVALFSGSLYLLVTTGARWMGAITPLGGVALIAGWMVWAVGALKQPSSG